MRFAHIKRQDSTFRFFLVIRIIEMALSPRMCYGRYYIL